MPINVLIVKELSDVENVRQIQNITDNLELYLYQHEISYINKLKEKYDVKINVFQQNILYEYNDEFFVPENSIERQLQMKDTIEFLKDNIADYNLDFISFEYKQDEYLNPLNRIQIDNLLKDDILNSTILLDTLNQNIDFSQFDLNQINTKRQYFLSLYKDLEKFMFDNKIYQRILVDLNSDINYYKEYIDSVGFYFVENNKQFQYHIFNGNLDYQMINQEYQFFDFKQNETVTIDLETAIQYTHTNYQLLTLEEKIDNFKENNEYFVQNQFNLLNINYCYDEYEKIYSLYINLKDNLNFIYDRQINNIVDSNQNITEKDYQSLEKNKISYWYKNADNTNYKISYNYFTQDIKHRQFVYTLNYMFKKQRNIIDQEKLLGQINYNKKSIENSFESFLRDMVNKNLILDYNFKIKREDENLKFEIILRSNRLDDKMYKAEN